MLDDGYTFITTNFVLAETITLTRYNLYHVAAVQLRDLVFQLIDAGLVDQIRVNEAHEEMAWEIFKQYDDQSLSYVDCTSFAVMRDLNLSRVFTADHHFAILGFILFP